MMEYTVVLYGRLSKVWDFLPEYHPKSSLIFLQQPFTILVMQSQTYLRNDPKQRHSYSTIGATKEAASKNTQSNSGSGLSLVWHRTTHY